MAFTEDLSQFFDPGEFAVSAAFTRAGAPVITTNVIFNAPSHEVEFGQAGVEEPAPFLMAPSASVAAVRRKDAVAVGGAGNFKVERLHPDGTGMTIVYLSEVSA